MIERGHFVDNLFPFSERPERPGPMRHVGLVFEKLEDAQKRAYLVLFYTTTAAEQGGRRREGTIKVSEVESMRMGMAKPFAIDTRCIAILPATKAFFPDIDKPQTVIKGTASEHLFKAATRIFDEGRAKHAEFETRGPIKHLKLARAR